MLAFILLLLIVGASNSKNPNTPTTTASSNTIASTSNVSNTASTPKLNQPANDGKFQFTVTGFECGQSQITQSDDSYEVANAQGQFCTMNLSVKNIGTEAQAFDDSSQYLYDSSSKQYSTDSNGTIAANPSSSQFMELLSVNPGVTISGVLAFDIPKNVTPTYAVLHDSALSEGVKVEL